MILYKKSVKKDFGNTLPILAKAIKEVILISPIILELGNQQLTELIKSRLFDSIEQNQRIWIKKKTDITNTQINQLLTQGFGKIILSHELYIKNKLSIPLSRVCIEVNGKYLGEDSTRIGLPPTIPLIITNPGTQFEEKLSLDELYSLLTKLSNPLIIDVTSVDVEKNRLISLVRQGIRIIKDFDPLIPIVDYAKENSDFLDFFKGNGLIPTIVQDGSKNILMLAYSTTESFFKTVKTKCATYFSRSRNKLWVKGETSGNVQKIVQIAYDCDGDTLLYTVKQQGVACHTNSYSCFNIEPFGLETLYSLIKQRQEQPSAYDRSQPTSFTVKLLENIDLLKSKIIEEAKEVVNFTDRENLIWELADLSYFLLVLMVKNNITLTEVKNELWRRRK